MKREALIRYRGKRSQVEMAKKYNVTQQAWSNWEQGKDTPKIITMKKMEMDSGVAMEELFNDIFNKKIL